MQTIDDLALRRPVRLHAVTGREDLIDRALDAGIGANVTAALVTSLQVQRAQAVMCRLQLLVLVIVLQLVVAKTPASLAHRAIAESGEFAWLSMWALVAVAGLGLVDLVVNDLMPDRFVLPTALQHRELVYMLLALGCASVAFFLAKAVSGWSAMVVYLVMAAFAGAIAVIDLFARKGGPSV